MSITFNNERKHNSLTIQKESIISILDEFNYEEDHGRLTIDLLNGVSYLIYHSNEGLGTNIVNNELSNIPFVIDIIKRSTIRGL